MSSKPDGWLHWLRTAAVLAALAILPAAWSGFFHPARPHWDSNHRFVPEIQAAAVRGIVENIVWVDARSRQEFEEGHQPGAVLLNEDDWELLLDDFLDAWTEEAVVIVYCGSDACRASQSVAVRLRAEIGLDRILVLAGGWQGVNP